MGVNSTELGEKRPDDGAWGLPNVKRWRERTPLGDWGRVVSDGTKQDQKRGVGHGGPLRGFQKEKGLDKCIKGAERKTGVGGHLVEQRRLKTDHGGSAPEQEVRGVACKCRTLFPETRLKMEGGRKRKCSMEKLQEETE